MIRYYLQELKGTFDKFNLYKIDTKHFAAKREYIAHAYQIPNSPLTKYLMPKQKDFSLHWYKGEALTSDNHGYGGHHLGKITKISDNKAQEITAQIKN